MTETTELVRRYYAALDGHDYDELRTLLAAEFVQVRPDRRFDDREAFVRFMRDERPNADTTHELLAVVGDDDQVAVRGRVDADGEMLFAFADFFTVRDGHLVRLETYSR